MYTTLSLRVHRPFFALQTRKGECRVAGINGGDRRKGLPCESKGFTQIEGQYTPFSRRTEKMGKRGMREGANEMDDERRVANAEGGGGSFLVTCSRPL